MSRVVRSFGVYYDVVDPYRIAPGPKARTRAEQIAWGGAAVVARYAGAIVLQPARGAQFPEDMRNIDPEGVNFPTSHSLFFTRRGAAQDGKVGGQAAMYADVNEHTRIAGRTTGVISVQPLDFTGIVAMGDTSRAIALGLGVEPCRNTCIMNDPAMATLVGAAFCRPCVPLLGAAGQHILSQQQ